MTILISKVGTQIQIRMGIGSATFPIMGSMRGQYVFRRKKKIFLCFSFFYYYYFGYLSLILLNNYAYWLGQYSYTNKNGGR